MKKIYYKILSFLAILALIVLLPKVASAVWMYVNEDVTYTVTPVANVAPAVNAGPDQTVTIGSAISLPWTATDSDGIVTNTFWQFISGPAGSSTSPSSTNPMVSNASGTATFTVTNTGTYLYRLNAEDDDTAWGWDEVVITVNTATQPDLVAGATTPTTGFTNTSIQFTSVITNQSTVSTGIAFNNFFQVASAANGGGSITNISSTPAPMSALGPSGTNTATSVQYMFTTTGVKSVRACADGISPGIGSVITESNEGNNCSGWVNVTITASPQCSDGIDNGDPEDTLADTSDPGCHSDGNAGNPASYDPNDNDETDIVGTPECSDDIDNADPEDVLVDKLDPGCIDPNTNEWDPNDNDETDGAPDLTASSTSPSVAIQGVATNISSTIRNIGIASTGASFTNLFQFDNNADHTTVTATQTVSAGPIAASGNQGVSVSYTFATTGTWHVRACADNDASWNQTISESNEGNNCGNWVTVTVDPAVVPIHGICGASHWNCTSGTMQNPATGASSWTWDCMGSNGGSNDSCTEAFPTTQCSDGVDNGDPEDTLADTSDPGCHSDGNAGNPASYVPSDDNETDTVGPPECSDGIDNADAEDLLKDDLDPGCHTDGNENNPASYDPNDDDETNKKKPIFIEF